MARKHDYMLLGRLLCDCKYYLGNGNRKAKHLWTGDYAAHLLSRFNDRKECSKIFSRCRLVAYRNCISIGDARHHLISAGKI